MAPRSDGGFSHIAPSDRYEVSLAKSVPDAWIAITRSADRGSLYAGVGVVDGGRFTLYVRHDHRGRRVFLSARMVVSAYDACNDVDSITRFDARRLVTDGVDF